MNDIAVAHKDFDTNGGGERVAEALCRAFDAPMFVGRKDRAHEPDVLPQPIREIDYSPLPDRVARWCIDRGGVTRSGAYQLIWQQQPALAEFDAIVTSGNEPLWYVPEDHQTVIAYTHSTPRWQYDLFHDHDGLLHVGYNYVSRVLYQHNIPRVDQFVANSDLVARRINLYWDVPMDDIEVVYPPIPVDEYSPAAAPDGEYYLHLGRLVGHKHVGEIVQAFNESGLPLKIAGKGPDRRRLETMAEGNIEFCGFVDEPTKHELMAGAKAHVYPARNEDFGMVPIESMAAGTPVIGVGEGFTQYQIVDGNNGILYDRGAGGLADAIRRFERSGVAWTPEQLHDFAAEYFGQERFRSEMCAVVKRARKDTAVTTSWSEDHTPTLGDGPNSTGNGGGDYGPDR